MKGIILAGGTGSRLFPLTKVINKHLLPVGSKPMIQHAIEKLVQASITDIAVVSGIEHVDTVAKFLGSGKDYNCRITLKVQDRSGGIAEALGLCEDFAYGERICVILGDNIFQDSLVNFLQAYQKQPRGARILLKVVSDPTRFGIAVIDTQNQIMGMVEKPNKEQIAEHLSAVPKRYVYAITGIYFYDSRVFKIIKNLVPSDRGELEITDVNRTYLEWGEIHYSFFDGYWTDAGTLGSYHLANKLVNKNEG